MQVCIPCRNPHALTDGDSHCLKCGSDTIYMSGVRWCPPKKNNKRAWKRIANGEWLWDRRRVVRIGRRHGYGWYRVELPTHKPGQEGKLMLAKKNERTTADMGG